MPHQMIDRYTNTVRGRQREFGIYLGSAISPQAIYFKEKVLAACIAMEIFRTIKKLEANYTGE